MIKSFKQLSDGKKVVVLLFAGIMAFHIFQAATGGQEGFTEWEIEPDLASAAYVVSQNYVRDVLKSPSTAEFPYGSATESLPNVYQVRSHVDSQNGFGAMIRSNYSMELKYNGGEPASRGSWELQSFIFDGERVK